MDRDIGATTREIWSELDSKALEPPRGLCANQVRAEWDDIAAFMSRTGYVPNKGDRRNDCIVFYSKKSLPEEEPEKVSPNHWKVEAYLIGMMQRRRGATCWEMVERVENLLDVEIDVDEVLSYAGQYGHIPDPDPDAEVYDQVFVWGKPKRNRARAVKAIPRRQRGKVRSYAFAVQQEFDLDSD